MENTLKKRTNKKGFTLVELVIVIAILAILAAIAVPTASNIIKTANENVDKSNAQTVEMAIKSAYTELDSKAWDGKMTAGDTTPYTTATLTVNAALKHNGISELMTPKSGNFFTYSGGKIYCDSDHATTKFDGTKEVKTIMES